MNIYEMRAMVFMLRVFVMLICKVAPKITNGELKKCSVTIRLLYILCSTFESLQTYIRFL